MLKQTESQGLPWEHQQVTSREAAYRGGHDWTLGRSKIRSHEARIAIQQLANRKPAEPVPPTEGKCWIVRFSNNPSFTIFGIFATRDAANAAAAHYGTGNNLVVEEHPIQLGVITMGRLVTP